MGSKMSCDSIVRNVWPALRILRPFPCSTVPRLAAASPHRERRPAQAPPPVAQFHDCAPLTPPPACHSAHFGAIDELCSGNAHAKGLGPHWVNLYGAINGFDLSTVNRLAMETANLGAKTDWRKKYNNNPGIASTYRGRILVSQKTRSADDLPAKWAKKQQQPFRRPIKAPPNPREHSPPTQKWCLQGIVLAGNSIPIASGESAAIRVTCGEHELCTEKVKSKHGHVQFNEFLRGVEFDFPIGKSVFRQTPRPGRQNRPRQAPMVC